MRGWPKDAQMTTPMMERIIESLIDMEEAKMSALIGALPCRLPHGHLAKGDRLVPDTCPACGAAL